MCAEMIRGSNSIVILEYKQVNIKLSVNLHRLTVETEVEQTLKSLKLTIYYFIAIFPLRMMVL